jgi:VWFA-related protein
MLKFALSPNLIAVVVLITSGLAIEARIGQTTKSGGELMTADVIVRDGKGVFVPDLTKDDFEVREDGVVQPVTTLTVSRGGRITDLTPGAPRRPQLVKLPARPGSTTAPGRIVVVVVDDLHLSFVDTGRLRELLKRTTDKLVHEGDPFSIVSTGPSGVAVDVTINRTRLEDAIGRMSGSALQAQDILTVVQKADGREVRQRAQISLATAQDLIAALQGVTDRRKTVIYVSSGYDFGPLPQPAMGAVADAGGGQPGGSSAAIPTFAELAGKLEVLAHTANRANAAIYTIDGREVLAPAGLDRPAETPALAAHRRATLETLRMLSERTGAFTVLTREGVDEALTRIDAETGDYYVIGYSSSSAGAPVRSRSLEIRVLRPGVEVKHAATGR